AGGPGKSDGGRGRVVHDDLRRAIHRGDEPHWTRACGRQRDRRPVREIGNSARRLCEHGDRRAAVPSDLQRPVREEGDVVAIVRGLLAKIEICYGTAEVYHLRGDYTVAY